MGLKFLLGLCFLSIKFSIAGIGVDLTKNLQSMQMNEIEVATRGGIAISKKQKLQLRLVCVDVNAQNHNECRGYKFFVLQIEQDRFSIKSISNLDIFKKDLLDKNTLFKAINSQNQYRTLRKDLNVMDGSIGYPSTVALIPFYWAFEYYAGLPIILLPVSITAGVAMLPFTTVYFGVSGMVVKIKVNKFLKSIVDNKKKTIKLSKRPFEVLVGNIL